MKVSIITVCYNSEQTIRDTIESVLNQTHEEIEYIVIDGLSSDGTMDIVQEYAGSIDVIVSEKDKGLYDAMNKGIELATGDLVGILNSDDVFSGSATISEIVSSAHNCDGVFADIGFYDETLTKKTRHYSSKGFHKAKFSRGFMPAHPSCYLRKEVISQVGKYSLDYKIAADFDYLVRAFSLPNISFHYLNKEVVKMREGGVSTSGISANITLNKEIISSCKQNGLSCTWLSVMSKYPEKLLGLVFT
ncbi:glycosyltransferase family 2 protein [Vibrio sp. CAU 1672]|uniref:glycosyltransferase family 2 protein n=1 Tax=Vibrio sp. CAU 1672 TaxID=3032594 RepID=UPI0023DC14FA|nr:glycosyltransferase family 2 protein [Vibrio sp. CAU 1672]MDF2155705.1 glycosyltransferase family 2 protein [Vibrio sp. CAU 1672]